MKPGFQSHNRQSGMVLVLALLILFVLTLLGASSLGNSHIQERAAGNARLQAQAFEAAAAGSINAINLFEEMKADATYTFPDELCGAKDHVGWEDDNPTDWVDQGTVGGASLKQRFYCLADEYPDESGGRPARSELFVLSRGEVFAGSEVVAVRDIEVRLDIGNDGGAGDGCGAICFPSCNLDSLDFPNSNAFEVDGNGGVAITSNSDCGDEDTAAELRDAIGDNRIGNYNGGVESTQMGEPWNDADKTDAFRESLKELAIYSDSESQCQGFCYNNWAENPSLDTVELNGEIYMVDRGNNSHGTVDDPQITYYDGNVAFDGTISGSGIMVVTGDVSWNGTNEFQGLIIVLGGLIDIVGGGQGGDPAGSLVVLNLEGQGTDPYFSGVDALFTGGGNAEYNFDCDALWAAYDLTGYGFDPATNEPVDDAPWSPECETAPPSIFLAGPPELIIASWRENIGWRELEYGAD